MKRQEKDREQQKDTDGALSNFHRRQEPLDVHML
jgi:hypothetical protein